MKHKLNWSGKRGPNEHRQAGPIPVWNYQAVVRPGALPVRLCVRITGAFRNLIGQPTRWFATVQVAGAIRATVVGEGACRTLNGAMRQAQARLSDAHIAAALGQAYGRTEARLLLRREMNGETPFVSVLGFEGYGHLPDGQYVLAPTGRRRKRLLIEQRDGLWSIAPLLPRPDTHSLDMWA